MRLRACMSRVTEQRTHCLIPASSAVLSLLCLIKLWTVLSINVGAGIIVLSAHTQTGDAEVSFCRSVPPSSRKVVNSSIQEPALLCWVCTRRLGMQRSASVRNLIRGMLPPYRSFSNLWSSHLLSKYTKLLFCEIWGSHSGGYEDFYLLGYNATIQI
jgi:hypothetical protein